MAENVNSLEITVTIKSTVTGDDGARLVVDETYTQTFANGTAADQVGCVFQDLNRPLNTTSEDINLDGVTDFQGAALGATNVAMMYVRNLSTTTSETVTIGGASSNGFIGMFVDATDKVIIGPEGMFLYISPNNKAGITASTGDLLKVETSANSSFRLIYAGDNS